MRRTRKAAYTLCELMSEDNVKVIDFYLTEALKFEDKIKRIKDSNVV